MLSPVLRVDASSWTGFCSAWERIDSGTYSPLPHSRPGWMPTVTDGASEYQTRIRGCSRFTGPASPAILKQVTDVAIDEQRGGLQSGCFKPDGAHNVGQVTVGAWSPTLRSGLGNARIHSAGDRAGGRLTVQTTAGPAETCAIVELPFFDKQESIPGPLRTVAV
jgi:hypothetical protein